MPYSAGSFSLYSTGNPVVTGSTISSSWANNTLNDIATGMSSCFLKDGTQTITANLPMSGFKFTGLAAGTTNGDSVRYEQLFGAFLPITGGTLTGNLLFTDATYDIGASGATRPRDLFLSRNAVIGGTMNVTGHTTFEGVTSTGATGTGKLVYDTSPTIATPTISSPVLSGTVTGTYTLGGTPTIAGTLSAGTTNTLGPSITTSTKTTQAHGLGAIPTLLVHYLECTSADNSYSVGDRIYSGDGGGSGSGNTAGYAAAADATNTYIITGSTAPCAQPNGGGVTVALDVTKWKIVIKPYKLN